MEVFVTFILPFSLKISLPVLNWKNYAPLFFKTDTGSPKEGAVVHVIQSASVAALTRDVFFHSVNPSREGIQ